MVELDFGLINYNQSDLDSIEQVKLAKATDLCMVSVQFSWPSTNVVQVGEYGDNRPGNAQDLANDIEAHQSQWHDQKEFLVEKFKRGYKGEVTETGLTLFKHIEGFEKAYSAAQSFRTAPMSPESVTILPAEEPSDTEFLETKT